MKIYYTAVKRFDSSAKDSWEKFVNWSGLFNFTEAISLDCSLCPSLFLDLVREDWDFIEPEVIFHDMFRRHGHIGNAGNVISKKQLSEQLYFACN